MRHTSLLIGGLLSTLAMSIQAQHHHDEHAHETSSEPAHADHHAHKTHDRAPDSTTTLGAHEHGVASLNMVVDGNSLLIELQSPAANIVGFEYTPTSEQDLATVESARQRLTRGGELFAFPPAAGCALDEVETESPLFVASKGHGDDHHEDHAEGHHEAHDDHHEEDHHGHAAHEDHADHKSVHADIAARFHFACDNVDALQQVDVKLFETFPNTEKLLLQAITPAGQQGGELTPAQSRVRF